MSASFVTHLILVGLIAVIIAINISFGINKVADSNYKPALVTMITLNFIAAVLIIGVFVLGLRCDVGGDKAKKWIIAFYLVLIFCFVMTAWIGQWVFDETRDDDVPLKNMYLYLNIIAAVLTIVAFILYFICNGARSAPEPEREREPEPEPVQEFQTITISTGGPGGDVRIQTPRSP